MNVPAKGENTNCLPMPNNNRLINQRATRGFTKVEVVTPADFGQF
jgi:hypothetical protein